MKTKQAANGKRVQTPTGKSKNAQPQAEKAESQKPKDQAQDMKSAYEKIRQQLDRAKSEVSDLYQDTLELNVINRSNRLFSIRRSSGRQQESASKS